MVGEATEQVSMNLMASLAPARAEVGAEVGDKADQYNHPIDLNYLLQKLNPQPLFQNSTKNQPKLETY